MQLDSGCVRATSDVAHRVARATDLFDFEELDVEDQLRVGGDAGKSTLAVGEMRGDADAALTTDGHAGNTDVPALDDLALAELEGKRLALLVGYNDSVSVQIP